MNRLLALEEELSRYHHSVKKQRHLAKATAYAPSYLHNLPRAFTAVTGLFRPEDISRMKTFLVGNAMKVGGGKNCIDTLNTALRTLLNDQSLPGKSSIQGTMAEWEKISLASSPTIIEFLDANGKVTKGTNRPVDLSAGVYDTMKGISKNEKGWSVFGMSIMDGYHSTLVSFDNSTGNPSAYWSDQWPSKGGWKYYGVDALDTEIEQLTQKWWDKVLAEKNKRYKSRLTLWRLFRKVV